jgi:aromatic-L-amino-acid decarboxylase
MQIDEFKQYGHQLIDWIADYYEHIEEYPVKSRVQPGEILNSLPDEAPEQGENFDEIFKDFETQIMPGITHWQHPSFFAYFNANTSFPSVLGELLTSAIGAQGMIWETSPAAAELEEKVCEWIKIASGLPAGWSGVIQDTASTATLCALLMAREKMTNFAINKKGFDPGNRFTIYCSSEAHSSVEKGVKIAGFGSEQLRKIAVDSSQGMASDMLEEQIQKDKDDGFIPLCAIAAVGSTGTHAIDPVRAIGEICEKHDLFYHVDAAHAGNVALLPEFRWMIDGLELADTYVFNPHKWMFTNFDCSLFYTGDKASLIRTFEIMPEYLKTDSDKAVNNYRDWGIQLGRRFRALKLWFVLRSFGLNGIREKFREHISMAKYLSVELEKNGMFEILAPVPLNLVCFRYNPGGVDEAGLNELNSQLERSVNDTGEAFITHTKIDGKYTLRACIGQTNVEKRHVQALVELLRTQAQKIGQ